MDFRERMKDVSRANTMKFNNKYQDNPELENGRLIDEFLFDSEYIRYRDIARFNAMR